MRFRFTFLLPTVVVLGGLTAQYFGPWVGIPLAQRLGMGGGEVLTLDMTGDVMLGWVALVVILGVLGLFALIQMAIAADHENKKVDSEMERLRVENAKLHETVILIERFTDPRNRKSVAPLLSYAHGYNQAIQDVRGIVLPSVSKPEKN